MEGFASEEITTPGAAKPRRTVARTLIAPVGSFTIALAAALGAALVAPAGAGGVDNLIIPVIVFPAVWTALFLLAFLYRSGEPARRRLYALHSWTGLVFGLFALVVLFTGAIAVFASELGAWGRRARLYPAVSEIERPSLTPLIERLGKDVDPLFREEVSLFQRKGGPLTLFFHTHGTDEKGKLLERGVRFDVDPATHAVVLRRQGTDDEVFAPTAEEALSRFFVKLHVQLFIPEPVGLYATGVVGFALMLLIASGVVVHRRFFAEAFQRRRGVSRRLVFRDLHTITGVWTLPYALAVAFTGAYFSFGDSLLLPGVAKVAFGGDEGKLLRALVGDGAREKTHTGRLMPDLDAVLADARQRVPAPFGFVAFRRPGQSDARINVFMSETRDRLVPAQLEYDGVTGAFLGEKPLLGTAPSAGAALAAVMGPLHFGNFAGVLSKSLWAFLAIGCCLLVCSGLAVWSERRIHRSVGARGGELMRRVLVGAAAGMPAASFAAVIAWAVSVATGADAMLWMGLTSALVLVVSLLAAARARSLRSLTAISFAAGGALALITPFVTTWAVGVASFRSPPAVAVVAVSVDALLIGLGLGMVAAARALARRRAPTRLLGAAVSLEVA